MMTTTDVNGDATVVPTEPGGPQPVASVHDLHVTLHARDGAVMALRGVSLDIAPGEIVALVGESGSGKSVLGSSLLGLLPATARPEVTGSVTVAGHDMVRSSDKELRRVRKHLLGAVFQDPLTSLNPTMRIGRQLVERTDGLPRALKRMAEAGLPEPESRVKQFPHQLSGGLRQRVMIAMALGGDGRLDGEAPPDLPKDTAIDVSYDDEGAPRLVIADEPTTALDVSVQAQIVLLFDRIRREHGCAVLLVTHDLGVAASIADRIAVMYAGRLCEVGPAADVLANPSHPYTKALLAARLSMDGLRTDSNPLPGDPPNPMKPLAGCAFAPRCAYAEASCSEAMPEMGERPTGVGAVACFHPVTADTAVPVTLRTAPPARAERTASEAPPALVLDKVSMSFAAPGAGRRSMRLRLKAVQSVSLTVPTRGSVALVGESGCGKTTTLRMAAGLSKPESGSVAWAEGAGRPQLVFQDASSSLTPWISVLGQVEERFRHRGVPKGERRDRAIEVLQRVGLDERAGRSRPRELSGGQRQRAVIARALASDPSLLICDEPVSALDASLVVRVLDLLEELRDQLGVALLVVTHDLAAARRIADTVAVMYLGRIVEEAPVEELFRSPKHPYTQGLIAANPTTEPGRLAPTLSGEPPSAVVEIVGCPFAARCPLTVDRCRVETPRLRELDGGRHVACHLVDAQPHRGLGS
jgi:peptide/nickel transport system ATP-binding protein